MNVFEACRYRQVDKVIFSSSIAVYGEPSADIIDEATPWTWSKLQPGAALYAASKIMGENFGKLYHDRYGVNSISLRYSSVYGERQHLRAVNSVYIVDTYDRLKSGERPIIPDDGLEVHDYIHVADVARANLMAMESDVSRESFNVATGTATTLNRLVEIVQEITGTNLEPEYKTPPGKIRAAVSTKLDFSIEKIERMIGWKPQISFEDGIRRLIKWREMEQARLPSAGGRHEINLRAVFRLRTTGINRPTGHRWPFRRRSAFEKFFPASTLIWLSNCWSSLSRLCRRLASSLASSPAVSSFSTRTTNFSMSL